ncbi:aromatic ring-hydroxylating dioxygenase subunit alpha [Burkholderia sp. L27(2015)]|uniref:aromatic ring-hydroxylating oxygenase subunit alpha n=1 Tax=Burkholderia sp. L27(2015) TaxID=1641858 RepID=UPI00131B6DD6|nr:Rieske 2Fe-2S domain-containing protein [Burkholderia sp. L27(2015)]
MLSTIQIQRRPQTLWNDDQIRALVQPDRVHRYAYVDPAIFELEMERVFGRAWIFVGHESQVAQPNDFLATTLGREPVLLTRDEDNQLHVIFNRCAHRGVEVCSAAHGNARLFRCPYHGWTYRSSGALAAIPQRKSYPQDLDFDDPQWSMRRVPRVDSYRGFVFASLSTDGPDLATYLNGIKHSLDDLVDRAPDGTISLRGGVSRYTVRANWKTQIDNGVDLHHASYAHASTLDEDGRQFSRHGGGPRLMEGKRRAIDWDAFGVVGFDFGHGYQGRPPVETLPSGPVYEAYVASLEAKHGKADTEAILKYDRFNSVIYPSLTFQAFGQHIRVVRPIAVDRTEVSIYPVWLDGAPEKMNRDAIRSIAATHSAASLIQTDDVEIFERAQRGLSTGANEWVMFAGHMGTEEPWKEGGWRGLGTSEFVSRIQYKHWLTYMCEGAGHE